MLPVVVLRRQYSESEMAFVIPARVNTYRASSANCSGSVSGTSQQTLSATVYPNGQVSGNSSGTYNGRTSMSCSGNESTTTTFTPGREVHYTVGGATFSLELPDGRIAVVNCDSKFDWMSMNFTRRSCRTPTVDRFDVAFNGDKAKLQWRVGVREEKGQSETYDLLEILDAPVP